MNFKTTALACAAVLGLGLAGCAGSGSNGNTTSAAKSQVRFFNAMNGANGGSTNVGMTIGNSMITNGSNGVYGKFTPASGYSNVNSGTFTATATGGGMNSTLQGPAGQTLVTGQRYTVVTAGTVGQVGTNAPQIFLLPDFNPAAQTIPAGDVAIRVVNLSPDLGNVGLYTTTFGTGVATPVSSTTSNISYGVMSTSSTYTMVPLSSLNTLTLRTTAEPTTNILLTNSNLSTFTLQPGGAYTIFVYGQQTIPTQGVSATIVKDFPGV